VRVAGACWPFGWTCLLVWQVRAAWQCAACASIPAGVVSPEAASACPDPGFPTRVRVASPQWCFSQYRMIAAWLFLQGARGRQGFDCALL
jgi:hypothetical protein